jgi:aminomethyltransferase
MNTTPAPLLRTPLHALHLELGAKMVPFAGYEMPVQYPTGVLQEHNHTRTAAGLFDVSHMGQVRISGANVAAAFETLVPVDIVGLRPGQQRYALFTNDAGGILDDLMVARLGDELLVVVNAACKEHDIALMQRGLADTCKVEPLTDHALIALQGPSASAALQRLAPAVGTMTFMEIAHVDLAGAECIVSRSGYTGEDGYEISVPSNRAEALARELLAQPEVKPIGLGARDSLRLEAGLCLYGHDIDTTTSPVEASLVWALSKVRRAGGERAGGYPGAATIERQVKDGVSRKRVGLRGLERNPVREGAELFASADAGAAKIGRVTSGGPAPTLGSPIAMGYVETSKAAIGTQVFAEVRGKRIAMVVAKTPFVPQRYYRG